MEVTEVKVFPRDDGHLRGFASITLDDCFVVRGLKIIQGRHGLFIAMPNRKVGRRCNECGFRNPVGNNYCGRCGIELPILEDRDRRREHRDIAHPINNETRNMIEAAILYEYERALDKDTLYAEDFDDEDY